MPHRLIQAVTTGSTKPVLCAGPRGQFYLVRSLTDAPTTHPSVLDHLEFLEPTVPEGYDEEAVPAQLAYVRLGATSGNIKQLVREMEAWHNLGVGMLLAFPGLRALPDFRATMQFAGKLPRQLYYPKAGMWYPRGELISLVKDLLEDDYDQVVYEDEKQAQRRFMPRAEPHDHRRRQVR